jgi:hypothetical protein
VAKLGTQDYGFVLDVSPPESEEKQGKSPVRSRTRYTRLYFDSNHNGDLTDDQVVEAEPTSSSYGYFPRVDVTLDVDGTEMEYAFYMRVYSGSSSYVRAYLYGAVYRHGEITLDGEKHRVVLTDFNSNGRFDDVTSVMTVSDGLVYPRFGDILFVDPDPTQGAYYGDVTTNDYQYPVAKLVHIGGRYYDMEVSPAGDKLTLNPSSVSVGHIANPNQGFRAVLSGDHGIVKVCGGQTGQAPLPVGNWKLLWYTIDHTAMPDAAEETSLLRALSAAVSARTTSSRPRWTMVSARAKDSYAEVNVQQGQTVDLSLGPPYKPVVTVSRTSGQTASLSLSLVGTGGEVCSNLMIRGSRPAEPQFTIFGRDGKEVAQGKFRYG